MGKTKLNDELIREAVKLIQTGLNDTDVCDALMIDRSTWYLWLQKPDTEMKARLKSEVTKAKAMRKAFHLRNVVEASKDGSWQASAWYLERAYPQEYGRCQRLPEKDERALDAVRELMRGIAVAAEKADDGA